MYQKEHATVLKEFNHPLEETNHYPIRGTVSFPYTSTYAEQQEGALERMKLRKIEKALFTLEPPPSTENNNETKSIEEKLGQLVTNLITMATDHIPEMAESEAIDSINAEVSTTFQTLDTSAHARGLCSLGNAELRRVQKRRLIRSKATAGIH
ncbi:hypothetical protein SDJN03_14803, partial [Cucurbita argyrosperma subsp. sororia]